MTPEEEFTRGSLATPVLPRHDFARAAAPFRNSLRTGLVLLVVSGCATPLATLTRSSAASLGAVTAEIRSAPLSNEDHPRLSGSLARVSPGLQRWGGLSERVTIHVVPDHDMLERAVRRSGFSWLRAWAQYDSLILQAPRTWTGNDAELDELLLHELTHCLLFQKIGTSADWASKPVPFWFREGMATVTAGQALRFLSLEDLADWLDRHADVDVFAESEQLSREEFTATYGLASHAMRFLLRRATDEQLNALLAAMKTGATFDDAFQTHVGTSRERFEADFVSYLRFRGFRGFGRKVRPPEFVPPVQR